MKTILSAFIAGALAIGAYAGDNLLKSEDFSKDNGWNAFATKEMQATGSKVDMVAGAVVCSVGTMDKQAPHFIQIQRTVDLARDMPYVLTFKLKSDKAGKLYINYQVRKAPWTCYASTAMDIAVGEKTYTFKFTPKADKNGDYDEPRMINFLPGQMAGTVLTISDVSIEKAK